MSLLEVSDIVVRFGGVVALDGPSFSVEDGQVCGLIGPNGAGKTTLFNCVSRLYNPAEGSITFDGDDLLEHRPHEVAGLGIARTFQNLALIHALSVRDNVMLGAHHRSRAGFASSALSLPGERREERRVRSEADEVLERLGLGDVADRPAGGLPYGTLKRVELARALCQRPRLLMLDEPASGLSHEEVDALGQLIVSLRDDLDLTVLLVEHHMGMVMRVSDTVVVLEFGQKIADGAPSEVQQDEQRDRGLPRSERVSLLEVTDLEAGYGPVTVLRGISFTVDEGRIVTVLGPNGAGKTTTLRALSGMIRRSGTIHFDGKDVSRHGPERMARHSIAHVPEGRGTFTGLTVEENLRVGAYPRKRPRRDRRRRQALLRLLPASTGAPHPARGGDERRRAADARDRARADAAPAADAARRALAGPGADAHARAVRDPRDDRPRGGRHAAARRAERQPRAEASPTTRTCWRRAGSCSPAPPRRSRQDEGIRRSYLGL